MVQSQSLPTPAGQVISASEAKYQRLFETATIGIFQSSPEGKVITANPEFARMFGYESPEDVIASVKDVSTDMYLDPQRRSEIVRLVMENPNLRSFENIYRRKDGSTFTGNLHIWTVHEENGSLLTIEGFVEDITERKQAEDALRKSEEWLRVITDNMSDMIRVTDLKGINLYTSPSHFKGLGYKPEERVGMFALDIVHPDDMERIINMFSECLADNRRVTVEYRVRHADGHYVWLETVADLLRDDQGNITSVVMSSRDISGRKDSDKELSRSEEKYRTLIETTRTGFVILDHDGLVLDANPEYVRLTGRNNLSEIVGKSVIEWTADHDKDKNAEAVRKCFHKGYIRTHEIDYVDLKSNITPIEINATCMEVEGRTHILTLCRDITERKRVENDLHLSAEALRRSEEYFRALTEHAADILFIVDAQGMIIYCSPSVESITGFRPDDLIGTSAFDLIIPDDQPRAGEDFGRALLTKDVEIFNSFRIRHKNGVVRIMEGVGKNLLHEPVIAGFVMNVRDVTERRRAEEELQESETKLQATFNQIGTGILIIDSAAQTIIEANQTAIEMTGLPKEKIIGQICHSLVCPAEAGKCPVKDLGQTVDHSERKLLCADGRLKDILKTVYPITIKGRDCYLESFIDISDRLRTERLLRESEERLQRAEKMEALGTLAGGVAHDLNNVLGVVVGYAELLLNSVDRANPMRPRLVNIMKGGERAAAIVQDLLTLARRGVPTRQVLNLNDMIIDGQQSPEFALLSSYHPFMQLKLELAPDLLNISGSPVHLVKTLYNLASNAGEAMPNGGVLTIKTANQYLDRPIHGYDNIREGDYVVLSVSDTGEGIPAADLKRIFEPFYTKKVMGRSGTGLGLAVVWGTVKDHQGYINVESEEGKGSIFALYFPVTRGKISAERITVAISEYMGKGETVLVVDDVDGQRDLATEMLRELNYNVTSVSSGEEAVTYLQEHKVDLMVLDMIMDPGMDGLDTYRSALMTRPGQKAIIVSGFSETYRVNAAQDLGAGAYLRKPYVTEKLGLAVRHELDRIKGDLQDERKDC